MCTLKRFILWRGFFPGPGKWQGNHDSIITNYANKSLIYCVSLLLNLHLLSCCLFCKGRGIPLYLEFSQSVSLPLPLSISLRNSRVYTAKDAKKENVFECSATHMDISHSNPGTPTPRGALTRPSHVRGTASRWHTTPGTPQSEPGCWKSYALNVF